MLKTSNNSVKFIPRKSHFDAQRSILIVRNNHVQYIAYAVFIKNKQYINGQVNIDVIQFLFNDCFWKVVKYSFIHFKAKLNKKKTHHFQGYENEHWLQSK